MIEIDIDPLDLGEVRFACSAVAEVQASLHGLRHPYKHGLHTPLASRVPATGSRHLSLLMDVHAPADWTPDALAPGQAAFTVPGPREQIETIQDVDLAVVASDLEWLRRVVPSRRWQGLRAGVFRQQLADAALWYWDNVLAGLWRRIEAIAQADRTYRSAIAADRGIAAALETVSPYLSVRGHTLVASGTATVSAPRMRYWTPGRGVWVVPTVLRAPRLSVGVPGGLPIISYGTRGAGRLWERGVAASRSLETLLGRTRANVLTALRVPGYTTALARDLDLPPSTVSDHLAALEGSGLLRSWREGRRMVYGLTELGERLLASSDEPRRRQAVPSRRGPRR